MPVNEDARTVTATVMPDGRISLPVEWLRRHGLEQGGAVILEETWNGITLRSLDQVLDLVQARSKELLAGAEPASVEEFLAERRREAARE